MFPVGIFPPMQLPKRFVPVTRQRQCLCGQPLPHLSLLRDPLLPQHLALDLVRLSLGVPLDLSAGGLVPRSVQFRSLLFAQLALSLLYFLDRRA